ncbi:hypothetical protein T09_205 [Trichinella sp. T9]|nr:hypothetical protein T09_205 [Trichinella sp. T9]
MLPGKRELGRKVRQRNPPIDSSANNPVGMTDEFVQESGSLQVISLTAIWLQC